MDRASFLVIDFVIKELEHFQASSSLKKLISSQKYHESITKITDYVPKIISLTPDNRECSHAQSQIAD